MLEPVSSSVHTMLVPLRSITHTTLLPCQEQCVILWFHLWLVPCQFQCSSTAKSFWLVPNMRTYWKWQFRQVVQFWGRPVGRTRSGWDLGTRFQGGALDIPIQDDELHPDLRLSFLIFSKSLAIRADSLHHRCNYYSKICCSLNFNWFSVRWLFDSCHVATLLLNVLKRNQ